jgi:hypothetical protein
MHSKVLHGRNGRIKQKIKSKGHKIEQKKAFVLIGMITNTLNQNYNTVTYIQFT